MSKVGVFLVLLFMSVSSFAQANFSGVWRGQGRYFHSKEGTRDCQSVAFTVSQTRTTIGVAQGRMLCREKMVRIPDVSGSLRANGDITYWGITIGRIRGNNLYIDTSLGGGRKQLKMSLENKQAAMDFRKDSGNFYEITNALVTRSNRTLRPEIIRAIEERAHDQDIGAYTTEEY